jgi:hypothetical protein
VRGNKHISHSVPRLHAPVPRRGQDLVDDLVAAVERRDVPIAVGNGAEDLLIEDGASACTREIQQVPDRFVDLRVRAGARRSRTGSRNGRAGSVNPA